MFSISLQVTNLLALHRQQLFGFLPNNTEYKTVAVDFR